MFLINGTPLALDVPFRDADGNQYPANWLRLASQEARARIGITEQPDPEPYDERYYWGRDSQGALIPKDADQIKEQRIRETKAQAFSILQETDWEMLRALERAMAPTLDAEGQELAAKRELVRSASSAAELEIASAESVSTLAEIRVDLMEAIKPAPVIEEKINEPAL